MHGLQMIRNEWSDLKLQLDKGSLRRKNAIWAGKLSLTRLKKKQKKTKADNSVHDTDVNKSSSVFFLF